jgi:hypothetical protein
MSISKKLFVLLLVAMVLATLASVTLVVTGHEVLVRDAWHAVASSAAGLVFAVVMIVGFVVFVVLT